MAFFESTGGGAAAPVFLHTYWRGRGTWIWAALRDEERALGFYEPLHEMMAGLTAREIAGTGPGEWDSGHPAMAPYWSEFAPLLAPGQAGVPGFRLDFATEDAFVAADEPQPALEAYLQGLLRHAEERGRVAVFKFCRSLGRAGWMRQRFPQALHVAVLRRPQALWESARRQFEANGNPYFLAMPLLLLARNACAPTVIRSCRALHVPLPRLRQADPRRAMATCRVMLDQLSWDDRYRAFLAFWLASALSVLAADCLFVDADMLAWSADYRDEVAATMARASGLAPSFASPSGGVREKLPPLEPEQEAVQRAALSLLAESRAALRPQGYVLAWSQLADALVRSSLPLLAEPDEGEIAPAWAPQPRFWALSGRRAAGADRG